MIDFSFWWEHSSATPPRHSLVPHFNPATTSKVGFYIPPPPQRRIGEFVFISSINIWFFVCLNRFFFFFLGSFCFTIDGGVFFFFFFFFFWGTLFEMQAIQKNNINILLDIISDVFLLYSYFFLFFFIFFIVVNDWAKFFFFFGRVLLKTQTIKFPVVPLFSPNWLNF